MAWISKEDRPERFGEAQHGKTANDHQPENRKQEGEHEDRIAVLESVEQT